MLIIAFIINIKGWLAKTLTFTRCQLKTFKDDLFREPSRVKTTRDLLVNRAGYSLRQKRVILSSITESLNVYKYAFRRAYKTNVYKYISRRAYKTISFFSLKHRLLYVNYRRALFFITRLDASFLLSLDSDNNSKSFTNIYVVLLDFFITFLSSDLGSRGG
jgi:hypothetical protein